MFETWKNAFKQEDLRKKILYTLFIIFIFRLGSAIPTPFINPTALKSMVSGGAVHQLLHYHSSADRSDPCP